MNLKVGNAKANNKKTPEELISFYGNIFGKEIRNTDK